MVSVSFPFSLSHLFPSAPFPDIIFVMKKHTSHAHLSPLGTFLFTTAALLTFFSQADAVEILQDVRIDSETIVKGYTITAPTETVRFAVWPNLVDEEVDIRIEHVDPHHVSELPSDREQVSDFFMVNILSADDPAKPLVLQKPYTVALKTWSITPWSKDVYYWDDVKNGWVRLPSSVDFTNNEVRAIDHLPYMRVVVLERKNAIEGNMSWYADGRADSAASNDFPPQSVLRVTNVENNKSVDVVVRSTGPFVPGRVIDVSRSAFSVIQLAWKGIARVRVERVE